MGSRTRTTVPRPVWNLLDWALRHVDDIDRARIDYDAELPDRV